MPRPTREGLIWHDNGFDLVPRWKIEPDVHAIRSVCVKTLELGSSDECVVTYFASGAFNKLYLVNINDTRKVLFRVALPVEPHHKTVGEVATMRWLRRSTTIPVPEIFAFDDTCDNEVGYEWILMQLMPGGTAYEHWRGLSMEAKKSLVEQVAEYQFQLFSLEQKGKGFRGIGTLSERAKGISDTVDSQPGLQQIVSPPFFLADRYDYPVRRGPFCSSFDWLDSFIEIIKKEQIAEMEKAEDEEEREDAAYNLKIAEKLGLLLPKIFPRIQNPPERTVLWHDDLSLNNILVTSQGSIAAIIDWECVSTKPYWVATEIPKFLRGNERNDCPIRDQYADERVEDRDARAKDDDFMDNEGKNDLYWIHLMEFEQTQLRKVYSDYMRSVWPAWGAEVADGELKTDFLGAVIRCSDQWGLKWVEQWIDEIEKGNFVRLAEVFERSRRQKQNE